MNLKNLLPLVVLSACTQAPKETKLNVPPATPIRTVTDKYYSVEIPDDYQYLEKLTDDSVKSWFKKQDDYARNILGKISVRGELLARIKELDESVAKVNTLRMVKDKVFYRRKEPDAESANLFMKADLKSPEKLLVDATKLGGVGDKRVYTINSYFPSPDGKLVAIASSPSGSEDDVTQIINVETGTIMPDRLEKTGFGLSWLPDSKGFFYMKLKKLGPDDPDSEKYLDGKALLHYTGTSQTQDREILSAAKYPNLRMERIDFPFLVYDKLSNSVFAAIAKGVQNEYRIMNVGLQESLKENVIWRNVVDTEDQVTDFNTMNGNTMLALTHKGTSNYKLITAPMGSPDMSKAETLVEFKDAVIKNFGVSRKHVVVQTLKDGVNHIYLIDKKDKSKMKELPLPFQGFADVVWADEESDIVVLLVATWTSTDQYYIYNESTGDLVASDIRPQGKFGTPDNLETKVVMVKSHDGVMVPMSIVYKKGTQLNGKNPTILDGYGAYGYSIEPYYNPMYMAWFEQGGVFASAHVRGGGEKGEDWYRAGYKKTKPNTWKDFIACAEYLINEKYTSPAYLAGMGTSAGGILIGRAMTERPDLFAVAVPRVGCMNAVRMEFTENAVNTPEFGTVKDSLELNYLMEMDAYHHIKEGVTYPASFVTAGMTDSRVSPWQPGKFAARLQAVNRSERPMLLRVEFEGGHGFLAASKTQIQEELADMMSFSMWQMGLAKLND